MSQRTNRDTNENQPLDIPSLIWNPKLWIQALLLGFSTMLLPTIYAKFRIPDDSWQQFLVIGVWCLLVSTIFQVVWVLVEKSFGKRTR